MTIDSRIALIFATIIHLFYLKKREELKEFALKHKKEIKGDVNVLLLILKYAGYKNNKGNDYKKLDLKRLGVLEMI